MVGVQHAEGTSWEGERDDDRENEMQDKNGRVMAVGKENTRASITFPVRAETDVPGWAANLITNEILRTYLTQL